MSEERTHKLSEAMHVKQDGKAKICPQLHVDTDRQE